MRTTTLEEVLDEIIDHRGRTPKKLGADFTNAGVPVISAKLIRQGAIDFENVRFVSHETWEKWMPVPLQEGDVILTSEAPLGKTAFVPSNDPLVLGQRLFALRGKADVIDNAYLRYWLESEVGQAQLAGRASGTTVLGIRQALLRKVEIDLPPFKAQRSVGKFLKALDDKIAANSRIIKIATHLNIKLVEKAVTKELEHLQNLADITMGSSPKGEFLNEEGIGEPFFQGVRDFGELFPSERVFAEKAVRTAQEGDILFAVRAPIGEVNIAERPCVIGRGIAAIRGKQSHLGLFYLLKGHPELWETYQSSGTVFAGINKSDLHNAVIPVLRDSEKLEQQLTPIHERAMHALRENQVLARTRDELLPLLMSGRITVGEAEDAADEAASES